MSTEVKVDFWGGLWDEHLSFEDKDEYIEDVLLGEGEDPKELTVVGYKRREIVESHNNYADYVLEPLLERLDEEYGGEDYSKPTDAMKSAALDFISVIFSEYKVWQCEKVIEETINVAEWRKNND